MHADAASHGVRNEKLPGFRIFYFEEGSCLRATKATDLEKRRIAPFRMSASMDVPNLPDHPKPTGRCSSMTNQSASRRREAQEVESEIDGDDALASAGDRQVIMQICSASDVQHRIEMRKMPGSHFHDCIGNRLFGARESASEAQSFRSLAFVKLPSP
jgi:hypothetical protein